MRILMLGNSLTTAHGLPDALAHELGAEVRVHARGGARLAEHLNPKTRNGARTLAALANETWDFVVLQEMSHAPATTPAAYLASASRLCALSHAAGAAPVVYATWAYRDGCPKLERLGMTYSQMHAAMHNAFARAACQGDALLADACDAFWGAADPAALYAPDGVHPSEAGALLAVRVLAETMRSAGSV
ncbi:SGNH/GDSL hydrolase family protein [Parafannyhessea sp. LCP21S3_E6]|uniref:SGNH/GDSL hydrolase family protein n=1 Tax=unclassified Parafannyhessea TaxID=2847323 RepID=UPI003F965DB4